MKVTAITLALGLVWIYLGRSAILILTGRFGAMAPNRLVGFDQRSFLWLLTIFGVGLAATFTAFWATGRWSRPEALQRAGARFVLNPWFAAVLILGMVAASLFMLSRGIGITIVTDSPPLPFRLTGLLFYARLLLFPIILCVIAANAEGPARLPLFLLVVAESAVASATSGSRLIALLHTAPLALFAFPSIARVVSFLVVLLANVNLSGRARNLLIPQVLADSDSVNQMYANAEAVAAANDPSTLLILPLDYVLVRTQGLPELLMLASDSTVCRDLDLSWRSFIAFMGGVGQVPSECRTVREVLRLPETAPGGFSLDFFGNLWMGAGGNILLYIFLCSLVGFMLASAVAVGRRIQSLVSSPYLSYVVCAIIFVLIMEGRLLVAIGLLLVLGTATLLLRARILRPFKPPHGD